MNTKIIYVVISSEDDNYYEQVWASAWSLKHHNPTACVVVLTDEATKSSIDSPSRSNSLQCIDEIRTIELEGLYTNKEKSRWIKTNMRNLVEGDFLFIDADTIITGDLSDIDDWTCSIGAVLDSHCHSKYISDGIAFKDMYINRLQRIFNVVYQGENVFNSGVLFVKDDETANQFFNTWHQNWLQSNAQGIHLDQLPMLKTNIELGGIIQVIPGEYNCQIRFSIQYLTRAKILHTFASQSHSDISIIFGNEVYNEIKLNHCITDHIKNVLINCKEQFASPSFLLGRKWMNLQFQPAYQLVNRAMDSDKMFDRLSLNSINFIARTLLFISRKLKTSSKLVQ